MTKKISEEEFNEAFASAVEEQNEQFQSFLKDPMGAAVWDGIMKHFDPSYDPSQRDEFAAVKDAEAKEIARKLRSEEGMWPE